MANSLQKMNVIEEQSHADAAANNACRVLVDSGNAPNSPLAYFFSITVAQPKIRIKIPKALAKSIQKTSDDQCNESMNKRGNATKKLFAKRVGLIFSKVFGHKQRDETCSSNSGENGKACSNGEEIGFDDMRSVGSMSKGCEKGVNDGGMQSRDVPKVALPKKKNILVCDEGGGKKKRLDKEDQLPRKSLFNNKKNRFSFCGARRSFSRANGVAATDFVIGKLERSPELARVPARTLTTHQKSKADRSIRKNLLKLIEEKGEREQIADEELCKKRILMGGKCRPLNHSGTLQYDKYGILLPENTP